MDLKSRGCLKDNRKGAECKQGVQVKGSMREITGINFREDVEMEVKGARGVPASGPYILSG